MVQERLNGLYLKRMERIAELLTYTLLEEAIIHILTSSAVPGKINTRERKKIKIVLESMEDHLNKLVKIKPKYRDMLAPLIDEYHDIAATGNYRQTHSQHSNRIEPERNGPASGLPIGNHAITTPKGKTVDLTIKDPDALMRATQQYIQTYEQPKLTPDEEEELDRQAAEAANRLWDSKFSRCG
jgi:hypothetical protein